MQNTKKSILKKTIEMIFSSILSKFLGIIRDLMQINFIGIGAFSDAFTVAYKIPNTFRKIFAEGALSAAFIPVLVRLNKEKKYNETNKLILALLIIVSIILTIICSLIFLFPEKILFIYAEGFINKPLEFYISIKLIKRLIFFILFISIGAILSGAMQAKHFFKPASWAPVFLNILYIIALTLGKYFSLSIYTFSILILIAGILQTIFFTFFYFKTGSSLEIPNKSIIPDLKNILIRFIPCIISMGALEINSIINASFSSAFKEGTYTLIDLAFRFTNIILSVFSSSFASILLPHFSNITIYAQKRLNFYLFETSKFILWITGVAKIFIIFFSYKIVYTIFYKLSGSKFNLENTLLVANLLKIYSTGLFFYSINKIILNIYYSINQNSTTVIVTLIGTIFNIVFNIFFIKKFNVYGLAISNVISTFLQTIIYLFILKFKFNFKLYFVKLIKFIINFSLQIILTSSLFYTIYNIIYNMIYSYLYFLKNFLLESIGFWFWTGPLVLLIFFLMYKTNKYLGIKIYFLN